MTAFVVIVSDPEATLYSRSPFNRNVNVHHATRLNKFDVNEHRLDQYEGWWLCETKEWAELQADALAKKYPGRIVRVAQVMLEYQTETPKVHKKTVSDKGVLPA
jgi:hypothetical protein